MSKKYPSPQGEKQFEFGRVLHLFCNFTNPPKPKLLVLVCVTPKPLLFIINSAINQFIKARPHLLDCQVALDPKEHKFLTHKSYIDCSRVIDSFSLNDIEEQVLNDANRIRKISRIACSQIVEVVTEAKTIEKRHKDWILSNAKL